MERKFFIGETAVLFEYACPKHLLGSHPRTPRLFAAITDQIVVDPIQHLRSGIKDLREDAEFFADVVAGCDRK